MIVISDIFSKYQCLRVLGCVLYEVCFVNVDACGGMHNVVDRLHYYQCTVVVFPVYQCISIIGRWGGCLLRWNAIPIDPFTDKDGFLGTSGFQAVMGFILRRKKALSWSGFCRYSDQFKRIYYESAGDGVLFVC